MTPRPKQKILDWLLSHPSTLVMLISTSIGLSATIGTAIAFGLTTPRTEIFRIDKRVDTVAAQVDTVRNFQIASRQVQDSILRVQRQLLALWCVREELPVEAKAVIQCDKVWRDLQAYLRSDRDRH